LSLYTGLQSNYLFTMRNRRLMLSSQMEGAENRPRTMYCEVAKSVKETQTPWLVYRRTKLSELRGHSFIHGESPGVAVRTGRRAYAP
jgi:hypothetical protein